MSLLAKTDEENAAQAHQKHEHWQPLTWLSGIKRPPHFSFDQTHTQSSSSESGITDVETYFCRVVYGDIYELYASQ